MTNLQPQVLAALIALGGVIVGLLLRGLGAWVWHLTTKGPTKDRAALIGTMADTIAKMKCGGVSEGDLENFEKYLKGKPRPDLVATPEIPR